VPPPLSAIADRLPVILRTLAIGLAGGVLAHLAGLPAGWLSGSVIAVTIASLARIETRMPRLLFDADLVLIGVILGAGVTPELVGRVGTWPVSLAALVVSVVAIQIGVQAFLIRVGRWDRQTAFFAALPGALSYVLAVAAETKADLPKVVVGQSLRLFLLVTLLPSVVASVDGGGGATGLPPAGEAHHILLALAAGIAGALVLYRLRFPGGLIAGSLAASAILHATGLVSGNLPYPVLVAAMVVLGAFTGSRFAGTDLHLLRGIALVSLGAFAIGVGIAAAFAGAVAAVSGIPFAQVLLAFTPGGLDAMTAMAIALHMDSAYVAAHQLLRFLLIALAAPIVARLLLLRGGKDGS
jgi:membrane AbrB-like protein